MKKVLFLLGLFLLGFCLAIQAQTSGSIRGEVHDNDGQPLPGVAVTIRSNALIGQTRITYSNELGVFRFPSLPVGEYFVEAALQGFESVRAEKIQVGLGATANVPLTMELSSVQEQVTVMGETQVLDITQSGLASSYKSEQLEDLPTQRNMWDLMQIAPGVTVDLGDSQSAGVIAFGSSLQSNSWNIDGVDVTAPETGQAWYYVNPDVIEEIQVIGVGAPAEYGNFTGAVMNVVTKKGGNTFHGTANLFYQDDALTDTNVVVDGTSFHRTKYHDFALNGGGPIMKDRVWFFGGLETNRDAATSPGSDPNFAPESKSDKYDIKISSRLSENNEANGFFHDEIYHYLDTPSAFIANTAIGDETGSNPAWGGGLMSTLSEKLLVELNYAGWKSDESYFSAVGSLEDPFINYDAPGGATFSGGTYFPFSYSTSRHQLKAKVTYYADHFLASQHEFRFGVQYSHGRAETLVGLGANGIYTYLSGGYLYQAQQVPYQYGGIANDLGFFVDDTVTVNNRLILNLGVRFDHNIGSIPDFERLGIGTPSMTPIGNFISTGEKIPGMKDLVDWNKVSPRLGFTWQPAGNGRSVIQGSFGVYYDHNVIGNWDAPPPQRAPFRLYRQDPVSGEFTDLIFEETPANYQFNKDLKPPRTLQYSAGYEQQIGEDMSLGMQYIYKDTTDLIGWEILGGVWQPFPFTDPFTGTPYTLLNMVELPVLQKGNAPGNFPGSEGLRYFQKYHGVVFTFDRRFSNRFALSGSYTWSRSTGLIPKMLAQDQNAPFFSSKEGSDPNNFINATGRLQGDRPHMFRVQSIFSRLPWDLQFSANVEFSSGRAHNRQIRVGDLGQGTAVVIMQPSGTLRFSAIEAVDLSVAKKFEVGNGMRIRVEGTLYNLLNSNQELSFASLELARPSETFVPDSWMKPRRLQLRLGFEF